MPTDNTQMNGHGCISIKLNVQKQLISWICLQTFLSACSSLLEYCSVRIGIFCCSLGISLYLVGTQLLVQLQVTDGSGKGVKHACYCHLVTSKIPLHAVFQHPPFFFLIHSTNVLFCLILGQG